MPRDTVSRTAHVGTVGKNGLNKRLTDKMIPPGFVFCALLEFTFVNFLWRRRLLSFSEIAETVITRKDDMNHQEAFIVPNQKVKLISYQIMLSTYTSISIFLFFHSYFFKFIVPPQKVGKVRSSQPEGKVHSSQPEGGQSS